MTLVLPVTYDIIKNYHESEMLTEKQRQHIAQNGMPMLGAWVREHLTEEELPWYELMYQNAQMHDNGSQLIDVDDLAALAQMQKFTVVRTLGLMDIVLFKNVCNSPQGRGRPVEKAYITFEQAKLFMLRGTSERCKMLQAFVLKLIDLMVSFDKMQTIHVNYYAQLENTSKTIIQSNEGMSGVYLACDTKLIDGNLPVVIGYTKDASSLNRKLTLLKFFRCKDPESVIEYLKSKSYVEVEDDTCIIIVRDQETALLLIKVIQSRIELENPTEEDVPMQYLKLQIDLKHAENKAAEIAANLEIIKVQEVTKRLETEWKEAEETKRHRDEMHTQLKVKVLEAETRRFEMSLRVQHEVEEENELKQKLFVPEDYKDEHRVKLFLENRTEINDNNTSVKALFDAYLEWHKRLRSKSSKLNKSRFEKEMLTLGLRVGHVRRLNEVC
jgi:hypothetical protein